MRGVTLSYETIREWTRKFGQTYVNHLRHKSPRPGIRWHLDEVFLKINGRLHYLGHAVDHDGDVMDIQDGSKEILRKLLKVALRPARHGHRQAKEPALV